jgi:ABC-type bacteriocin/lantibiotic exporter with double-glycine peptidase domain
LRNRIRSAKLYVSGSGEYWRLTFYHEYVKGGNIVNIEGIEIVKQKKGNTCGYATAGMLLNYLEGLAIDEDFLCENEPFDEKGIVFTKLLEIYRKYLKNHDATLIREDKDGTWEIIKQSLCDNLPLQVLHLTENLLGKSEPVLHYAILTGYDEDEETFTLADPYGFYKTMGKDEFFEAVSFRNDCLPEFVKKAMPSNAMIRFNRRPKES